MSVKHRHEDMSGSADFFWLGETVETRGTATGPKGPQVKTTLNPHSTKCGLFSLRCSQLLELRSS